MCLLGIDFLPAIHAHFHLLAYAYIMGLVARKPVFRGLRTIKAQASLRIRAV